MEGGEEPSHTSERIRSAEMTLPRAISNSASTAR